MSKNVKREARIRRRLGWQRREYETNFAYRLIEDPWGVAVVKRTGLDIYESRIYKGRTSPKLISVTKVGSITEAFDLIDGDLWKPDTRCLTLHCKHFGHTHYGEHRRCAVVACECTEFLRPEK